MKRREAVSHRVETYRTEMGSLMAHDITFQVEFDCRPEAEVPRESCLLPSRMRTLRQGVSQVIRPRRVRKYRRIQGGGSTSAKVFW